MRAWIVGTVLVATAFVVSPQVRAYNTNGAVVTQWPIPWYYNPAGAPEFEGQTGQTLFSKATGIWESVDCADISFEYQGETDVTIGPDGISVVYFISQDWPFQEGAAAVTKRYVWEEGQPEEVDMALNAADFFWIPGGGDATQTHILDPVSVMTHELGHWLGLAHSYDQFATMYMAKLPGNMQQSLQGDDKWGICSIYPNGQNECETDDDCKTDWFCKDYEGLKLCEEQHDQTGDFCSKDHLNCEDFCFISFFECSSYCYFYDTTTLDDGYCAPLCKWPDGTEADCPGPQWVCVDVSVQGSDIGLCYLDPTIELGPEPFVAEDAVEGPQESDAGPVDQGAGQPEPTDAGAVSDVFDAATTPAVDPGGGGGGKTDDGCSSAPRSGLAPLAGLLLLLVWLALRRRQA